MARSTVISKRLHLAATLGVLGVLMFVPGMIPKAHAADRSPTTAAEAMTFFEGQVDEWLDGPAEYIILDDERKAWRGLTTTEDREAFIEWFWARRDNDLREVGNPYKEAFYARVAEANDRFPDFPRGWRSDRGRVFITLGRPDGMRGIFEQGFSGTVWTYYTDARERGYDSPIGEVAVLFAQEGTLYEVAGGFGGRGSYPFYLLRAFEYANEAAIADGTLEFASPA